MATILILIISDNKRKALSYIACGSLIENNQETCVFEKYEFEDLNSFKKRIDIAKRNYSVMVLYPDDLKIAEFLLSSLKNEPLVVFGLNTKTVYNNIRTIVPKAIICWEDKPLTFYQATKYLLARITTLFKIRRIE